jgi:hypothetical protein
LHFVFVFVVAVVVGVGVVFVFVVLYKAVAVDASNPFSTNVVALTPKNW